MNEKNRASMKAILRFIRDFAIVVGGIAITLYVNDRVKYQSEKRDIKLYLNTIKLELEENIYEINGDLALLQPLSNYSIYLQTHNENSLNWDTLMFYAPMRDKAPTGWLKTNAFEVFKSSGIMHLMENRELLTDIWNMYAGILYLKEDIASYTETLRDEMKKEIAFEINTKKKPYKAPMYLFYTMGLSRAMKEHCENRLRDLENMVSEIEKELSLSQ